MKSILTILILAVLLRGHELLAQVNDLYKNSSAPVEQRVDDLLKRMTVPEKIDMLGGYNGFYIRPNKRLGIPVVKMADGPMGVRNYGEATAYPGGITMAATWNTDLVNRFGSSVGRDARSKGVHIMLAPGVNIYRAPMNGRNFEYFGEDPYLAGQIASAYIKGVQSQGVVATVKHFAANNSEYDRFAQSSDIDERTLQEIYLPAFKAAVQEGGAGAVMCSYNLVNGSYTSQNNHLINDILKGQWKFDGFIMSDWGATHDGVAAANAGLDLEMPAGACMNMRFLMPALNDGTVKEATIDDKIRRMLRVMFRMGFFDRAQADSTFPLFDPEGRLVALQAAREGTVLLKNRDNILPLNRSLIKSIAVIGPNAHPAVTGAGGSSRVRPLRSVSLYEGLIQAAGTGVKVYYGNGLKKDHEKFFHSSRSSDKSGGWKGEYFSNKDLKGKPEFIRTDTVIDFDWNDGVRDDFPKTKFSVRWTGSIHVDSAGVYDFVAQGDDGFRLSVDDSLVIDQWMDQGVTQESTQLHFDAHTNHSITFEYYQNTGGASVAFGWGKNSYNVDEKAVDLARMTDAAIVCIGFNQNTEKEGEDRSFSLPPEQESLIREVSRLNKKTIVVVIAGGNVSMVNWIGNVGGLLYAWYPGQDGGTAVGEIIFGDVNPSGKLPASFEKRWEDNACYNSYYETDTTKHVKYSEGVFVGYRHFDRDSVQPMFPFGYGLSYTTFEYKHLSLSSPQMTGAEKMLIKFELTNTGKHAGAEVCELYVHDDAPSEPRPVKELKGFRKIFLKAGETRMVEMEIDKNALSYFNAKQNKWIAELGSFEVEIGSSSKDIRLKKGFTLVSE